MPRNGTKIFFMADLFLNTGEILVYQAKLWIFTLQLVKSVLSHRFLFFEKKIWEGGIILSSGAEAFQMLNVFYVTESIFL